ncbi:hypothetical protein Tco_1092676 [Tanacetum coccineum]|uniref:Uncharacterized protein n=1 Tax=Tanacetum coccineum TaxID=301880 RepID=A0ABQ5IAI7_9ASTR
MLGQEGNIQQVEITFSTIAKVVRIQQHTAIETMKSIQLLMHATQQMKCGIAIKRLQQNTYYQAPKPQRSNATSSSTRQSASTRHKGKEVAKPITPQSESVSEEDSDPEQAQRDKEMQKNLALLAKYFKKLYKPTNNNLRTSSNSKNKTEDTTQVSVKDWLFQLQAEQADWLEDTMQKLEQELEGTLQLTWPKDSDVSPEGTNSTGLLALKDIEIKEGLKTKAYEISVLNQKHDELVKKSLLTKSQLEGYLKENTKVISDLKVKEEKDIDKMIEMDPTVNKPTFANPRYLKKAQSDKPCLYEIPFDTSDPANRFAPDREETMTLDNESRSKWIKDMSKSSHYRVSRPQLKCYQVKDKVLLNNSQVKFKKKEVEDHHRISSISKKIKSVTTCNDSSDSRTSNVNAVCAECGK